MSYSNDSFVVLAGARRTWQHRATLPVNWYWYITCFIAASCSFHTGRPWSPFTRWRAMVYLRARQATIRTKKPRTAPYICEPTPELTMVSRPGLGDSSRETSQMDVAKLEPTTHATRTSWQLPSLAQHIDQTNSVQFRFVRGKFGGTTDSRSRRLVLRCYIVPKSAVLSLLLREILATNYPARAHSTPCAESHDSPSHARRT